MRQGDQLQTSLFLFKKLDMRQKQMVCSLVSIYFDNPGNLAYNKSKLCKTLDHDPEIWSILTFRK